MTQVTSLTWHPYQGAGQKGSFIAQVVLDGTLDPLWAVPIISKYSNQTLVADGVIIDNQANNGPVGVTAGPLVSSVPPFGREPVSLDHSVTQEINFIVPPGLVLLTFYVGTPPINPVQYNYQGAAASVVPNLNPITGSISGDIPIAGGSGFVDGPSVAQGSAGGTWFATGTVTILATSLTNVTIKLWDGTSVISSSAVRPPGGVSEWSVALSGYITAPVSDIRISVATSPDSITMLHDTLIPAGKASTITAFRVAP